MAPRFSKHPRLLTFVLAMMLCFFSPYMSPPSALANNPLDLTVSDEASKESPLLIEADQGTTCDHKAHTCTATGNVRVTKGQLHLECQKLVVVYRESQEGLTHKKPEIERIEATGNARFTGKPGEQAEAPRMIYTLATREIILDDPGHQADPLKKDRYPSLKDIAKLPRAIKDKNLLSAPKITLFLSVDPHGKHAIERIKAKGRVLISTPDEIAFGDEGIYEPQYQRSTLQGDVIITHEPKPHKHAAVNAEASNAPSATFSSVDNKENTILKGFQEFGQLSEWRAR